MKPKNTICLWFDRDAHDAARFYAATFPDSEVTAVYEAPLITERQERRCTDGGVHRTGHSLCRSQRGPAFRHSGSFLLQIATDNQEETDRYWSAIVSNGGMESECGWCKDRWGISGKSSPHAD